MQETLLIKIQIAKYIYRRLESFAFKLMKNGGF